MTAADKPAAGQPIAVRVVKGGTSVIAFRVAVNVVKTLEDVETVAGPTSTPSVVVPLSPPIGLLADDEPSPVPPSISADVLSSMLLKVAARPDVVPTAANTVPDPTAKPVLMTVEGSELE